jgi:Flp pilus assembly pilin Flp
MNLIKDEKGVTAVEYAMAIGVVALFSFAAWKMLGRVLKAVMIKIIYEYLW